MKKLTNKSWLPFSKFQKNKYGQIFIAGIHQNILGITASLGTTPQLFFMTDALLTNKKKNQQTSVTYKSFYYGMTKSIELEEWPSQAWAQKDSIYHALTESPEDLAPIH